MSTPKLDKSKVGDAKNVNSFLWQPQAIWALRQPKKSVVQ